MQFVERAGKAELRPGSVLCIVPLLGLHKIGFLPSGSLWCTPDSRHEMSILVSV